MGEDGATVGYKGDSWFGSIKTSAQLGTVVRWALSSENTSLSLSKNKSLKLNYQVCQEEHNYFGRYALQWGTSHNIGLPF
jgi:hypothetical protein